MFGLDCRQEQEMRSVREGGPRSWNLKKLGCGERKAGTESDLTIKTIMWRQSLHCPGSTECTHKQTRTRTHTHTERVRYRIHFKKCKSSGTAAASGTF